MTSGYSRNSGRGDEFFRVYTVAQEATNKPKACDDERMHMRRRHRTLYTAQEMTSQNGPELWCHGDCPKASPGSSIPLKAKLKAPSPETLNT